MTVAWGMHIHTRPSSWPGGLDATLSCKWVTGYMDRREIQVIKLGGSLLNLPDLARRLRLVTKSLVGAYPVFIVGGGRAADLVRDFDETHQLGEQTSHWLAVRAMQLNTYLVAAIMDRWRMVSDVDGCEAAWQVRDLPLVDPLVWLENEHARGVTVPHRWTFASDSIAAHIAVGLQAYKLTLLKSALPSEVTCDVNRAISEGMLDKDFAATAAPIAAVEMVNLRSDPPVRCVLR